MSRILITAFEPYDKWKENASWLAMVELTRELPSQPEITTRLYPVDFTKIRAHLERDLAQEYDYAIHLGQAPGNAAIELEAIGLNVGPPDPRFREELLPLVPDGPVAYRTRAPVASWAEAIRGQGIPARVSYHAGTYLCNATLYLAHYLIEQQSLKTKAVFVHLPLDCRQVLDGAIGSASLNSRFAASAIGKLLELV